MAYGTVEYWSLIAHFHDGTSRKERLSSWEAASDAFHEVVKTGTVEAARVYAVDRNGREIKTWDYTAPGPGPGKDAP